MSLFVVTHIHRPEACPAGDPKKGAYLLKHLSKEFAGDYGVTIHAKAAIDGQYSLHLILEARDREEVEKFMSPFAQEGSVSVLPASFCEAVIARARC